MKSQYYLKVDKKWPNNCWIEGEGRYALVAFCRDISITLHEDLQDAIEDKQFINECGCGGACHKAHVIYDLEQRGFKECPQ